MTVVSSVEAELAEFDKRLAGASSSSLAAASLALAERIDNPRTSTTALTMAARELREHLEQLRESLPAEQEKDALDDLVARREARKKKPAARKREPAA